MFPESLSPEVLAAFSENFSLTSVIFTLLGVIAAAGRPEALAAAACHDKYVKVVFHILSTNKVSDFIQNRVLRGHARKRHVECAFSAYLRQVFCLVLLPNKLVFVVIE